MSRLIEVAGILGIRVKELWAGDFGVAGSSVFSWSDEDSVDWTQFPIKEMIKRKWFSLDEESNPAMTVKNYFLDAAGPEFVSALHRKKVFGGRRPNEFSLLAWQARVLEKARDRVSTHRIPEFEVDDSWLHQLIKLSLEEDGPARTVEYLEERGILLVIEPHLPGTYLDGAAMLSHEGNPVIGMTIRHDRLDNFWFVLLHELGHVFLHLSRSLRYDFFDEEDDADADPLEIEADQFALDAVAPAYAWSRCVSRFLLTPDAVMRDAQALSVHPSIVAGRLRKEAKNYFILNELLGIGTVRAQFGS